MLILSSKVLGCVHQQATVVADNANRSIKPGTELEAGEQILWINSLRVPCTGVGAQHCYEVQRSEQLQPGAWEYFYQNINGFNYQEGFIYQLLVKVEEISAELVPADASSIRYTLVKILDQQNDPRLILNNIWVLDSLAGQSIDTTQLIKLPYLEIQLSNKKIMGYDGCNSFNGSIERAENNQLSLGVLAATKRMCPQMKVPDQFGTSLAKVETYKIDNGLLHLYDKQGDERMTLRKTD